MYQPQFGSQALAVNPYGLSAAQAAQRRQNLNVQSHITQIGNNNVNAQSDIGQSSKSRRRMNMNVQSGVNQGPGEASINIVEPPTDVVEVEEAPSVIASVGPAVSATAVAGPAQK